MSSPSIKTASAYHNLIYEIAFLSTHTLHLDVEKNTKVNFLTGDYFLEIFHHKAKIARVQQIS